jgi:hypothetical protein
MIFKNNVCVCVRERERDRERERERERETERECVCEWRSEDNLWKSVLSVHHVDSRD